VAEGGAEGRLREHLYTQPTHEADA
jgi:hypothetical protein